MRTGLQHGVSPLLRRVYFHVTALTATLILACQSPANPSEASTANAEDGFDHGYRVRRDIDGWMARLPAEASLQSFSVGREITLANGGPSSPSSWVLLPGPLPGMLAILPIANFRQRKRDAALTGMRGEVYRWPTLRTLNQSVQLAGQLYALYAEDGFVDAPVLAPLQQASNISLCEMLRREGRGIDLVTNDVYQDNDPSLTDSSSYPPGTRHLRGDVLACPAEASVPRGIPPVLVKPTSLQGFAPLVSDEAARAPLARCRQNPANPLCVSKVLVLVHLRMWNLWDEASARSLHAVEIFPHEATAVSPIPPNVFDDVDSYRKQFPLRSDARILPGDVLSFEEPLVVRFTLEERDGMPWVHEISTTPVAPAASYWERRIPIDISLRYDADCNGGTEPNHLAMLLESSFNPFVDGGIKALRTVQATYERNYQNAFPP